MHFLNMNKRITKYRVWVMGTRRTRKIKIEIEIEIKIKIKIKKRQARGHDPRLHRFPTAHSGVVSTRRSTDPHHARLLSAAGVPDQQIPAVEGDRHCGREIPGAHSGDLRIVRPIEYENLVFVLADYVKPIARRVCQQVNQISWDVHDRPSLIRLLGVNQDPDSRRQVHGL